MRRCVALLLALAFAAEPAFAAIERVPRRAAARRYQRSHSAGPALVLRGGIAGYRMGDLNDFLDDANFLTGTSFEQVNGGGSFGAALRLPLNPNAALELGYERLTGTSEDASSAGKIDLDANLLTATISYYPPSYGGVLFGLGGGLGVVSSDAELRGTQRVELDGTGPAFYLLGSLEVPIGPGAALTFDGGLRYAVVSDVESAGFLPPNLDLDWTGPVLRGGLAVTFR